MSQFNLQHQLNQPLPNHPETDERIVKINLDDSVILDSDSSGDDLLRFGFEIEGKLVKIRMPAYGKWDRYYQAVANLYSELSKINGNLERPESFINTLKGQDEYRNWFDTMAFLLRVPKIVHKVENIFFRYLRPHIDGVIRIKYAQKKWLRNNLQMDHLVKIFALCLSPDDLIKKNTIAGLQRIYRVSPKLVSSQESPKNGDLILPKPKINQSSSYVSF